jgi:isochorismate hydrolase
MSSNVISNKIKAELSQLVIIDLQTKLVGAMQADAMPLVIKNCGILAQAASLLNVPVIVTEQYPQGLGETLAEIKQYVDASKPIIKSAFSAASEPKFNQKLHRDQSQIILSGMESHICVLQTALDLIKANKQVFVVEDAVISRSASNKANAIGRMRDAGCIITNTESVVFEWLGNAQHHAFKVISQLVR